MPDNNNNQQEESDNLTQAQREQIIREGTGYEPSVPVKRTYLPLRKKERLWGGVKYPGIFDYDPANDSGWFWFTVALEVASLALAGFLLEENIEDKSVLIVGVLCVFALDFTFAYFHHRYKSVVCLIENQKHLFLPDMRAGVMGDGFANYAANLEQKLKDNKDYKYLRHIFAFLIVVLSIVKAIIFLLAIQTSEWFEAAIKESQAPNLVIPVIIISYFWIAYNHLKFTGYFFAAYFNKNKYKNESIEYNRLVGKQQDVNERQIKKETIDLKHIANYISNDNSNPDFLHFSRKNQNELQKELNKGINEVKAQPHGVYKSSEEHIYTIHRYGLLTDDQLQKMINAQETQLVHHTED
jgi:hypothetical protein